jgi:hypothetical protein
MPLPAAWSLTFADRQPLHYLQVEPNVLAEIEADIATGAAGQHRHLTRHLRTRPDLLPGRPCPPACAQRGGSLHDG